MQSTCPTLSKGKPNPFLCFEKTGSDSDDYTPPPFHWQTQWHQGLCRFHFCHCHHILSCQPCWNPANWLAWVMWSKGLQRFYGTRLTHVPQERAPFPLLARIHGTARSCLPPWLLQRITKGLLRNKSIFLEEGSDACKPREFLLKSGRNDFLVILSFNGEMKGRKKQTNKTYKPTRSGHAFFIPFPTTVPHPDHGTQTGNPPQPRCTTIWGLQYI